MIPPISDHRELFPMVTENHPSGAIVRYSMVVATTSILLSFGCTARTTGDREQSRRAEASTPSPTDRDIGAIKHVAGPEGSFSVKLPTGHNWQVLRSQIGNDNETFFIAAANIERGFQLSVMVLPGLKKSPTLNLMKTEWEGGFLEKATRKKSSEDITISGRPAYKVTASLDAADGKIYELIGILMVEKNRNFMISITKRGENAGL